MLSPLGELQAHRLGEYLAQHELIDRIIASDLRRARSTAEIVASYLEKPVALDVGFREFANWDEGSPPVPTGPLDATPRSPAHPAHVAFRDRIAGALERVIGAGDTEETVLIVAHGGAVGAALRVLLGATAPRLWTANTALHGLRWTGDYWVVRYINKQEHLPRPLRSW